MLEACVHQDLPECLSLLLGSYFTVIPPGRRHKIQVAKYNQVVRPTSYTTKDLGILLDMAENKGLMGCCGVIGQELAAIVDMNDMAAAHGLANWREWRDLCHYNGVHIEEDYCKCQGCNPQTPPTRDCDGDEEGDCDTEPGFSDWSNSWSDAGTPELDEDAVSEDEGDSDWGAPAGDLPLGPQAHLAIDDSGDVD